MKQTNLYRRLGTLLICLFIFFTRAWERFTKPDLWAEDGFVFLKELLLDGDASFLKPYWGSYHTLQRIITWLGLRLFPLEWLPTFIFISCLIVVAAIASKLTEEKYEWLLPSFSARLGFALLFCMAPGLSEMLGNLCNLNWMLFFWLAFVGLGDLQKPISKWEMVGVFLVTWSIGTAILLLPLFTWRYWVTRKKNDCFALGLIAFSVFWLVVHKGDRSPLSNLGLWEVVATFHKHLARHVFLQPWLGDKLTIRLDYYHRRWVFYFFEMLFVLWMGLWAIKNYKLKKVQAVFAFFLPLPFWAILCWLVRPEISAFKLPLIEWFFQIRYSFPTTMGAVLVWMVLLHSNKFSNNRFSIPCTLFVLLNLTLARYRYFIPAYGEERLWEKDVATLKLSISTGEPSSIRVRFYPKDWYFMYQAPALQK